ncbi:MAG: 3-oxoacyl-(acyl-carrier-protein) reductase FabG [Syntrophorhabdus sp. PtaU1.Bin153]|nr:MAG: 3-oxoacyl-(acyl-carrier-protein) reductase FabG [Syntrophorhabdus sp. PtaU1.Bin153]
MSRITGKKTAMITGGSRGIGLAIRERFDREGINIVAPTRKELDLLSVSSIDAYVSTLGQPIDILINNAGINNIQPLAEVDDNNIQAAMQINLLAPFRLARALAPTMKERGYGRIVNISSVWAIVTKTGRAPYSMAKAGLGGMTRALAVELAPYNILVNAVAPGYVDTELTRQNNTDDQIEGIKKLIPMGRLAAPEEIAEVVAFLATEKNSYITGQLIVVDGGFTCL